MESFRAVSAFMRAPVQLSHRQRVTRLYRASLRLLDSWAEGDRGTFVEGGAYIRGLFDENKHLDAEGGLAKRLVREGEETLVERMHPDMYTLPYMPGGSKFMRNAPLPLEAVFPDGIPPEYNFASKDVNGIQVPMSAQPGGMKTVLIDFMTRTAK